MFVFDKALFTRDHLGVKFKGGVLMRGLCFPLL
ncbi:hypothetical protein BscR1v2_015370 [Bartonella schoenbuchensis R1]|uniref:Uncharacterized protein n=1 Tax=Bartonella schoenbuchensis (strain DSM 13525 / NCTC 13165 / R1) TaxID=687861 RepID=A0A1S6XSD8_BARSR|nr:hypothetical protein BscR1v2_015370 [Bartonella schoenbuchensis R1]